MRKLFGRSFVSAMICAGLIGTVATLATVRAAFAAEPAPRVTAAIDGVLDLFKQKSVVALGDAHGLAQEADFYSALVRDPRFAEQVGNVVVEFGGAAAQDIVDRYVAGDEVPYAQLRRVWTDVVGWFPGETTQLGIVNFFASVRAANLGQSPEHRIKVWLGDPKIDWSQTHSFQDVQPLFRKRDEEMSRIINEEILAKQKKTLLIVGLGHLFGPGGQGPLSAKINQANPNALAIVAPFLGYIEPECNAKFMKQAKGWPTPALAGPVNGSSLKSQLQLSGCNYVPPAMVERMKKMAAGGPPPPGAQRLGPGPGPGGPGPAGGTQRLGPGPAGGNRPSPMDMLAAEIDIRSGVKADAILYLGPPDTLTASPTDPNLYMDAEFFKEMSRRSQCCAPGNKPLDADQFLQKNTASPKRYEIH